MRSKKLFFLSLALLVAFSKPLSAQWTTNCTVPKVTSIMVDGCGTGAIESKTEYFSLFTGASNLDIASLDVKVSTINGGAPSIMVSRNSGNPALISILNAAVGTCGTSPTFIAAQGAPLNGVVPANSNLIVFNDVTATAADFAVFAANSLSGLCGSKIYVAFGTSAVSGTSIYTNYDNIKCPGSLPRDITIDVNNSACTSISYDACKLPQTGGFGIDGSVIKPSGTNISYINSGKCIEAASLSVTCPTDTPVINLVATCSCYNLSVVVSGGTAPYTYKWSGPTPLTNAGGTTCVDAGFYTVTVTDANGCSYTSRKVVPFFVPLTATFKATNATCGANNGSIASTPANGNAPYTYLWFGPAGFTSNNKDLTNLASGTYQVTVTDKSSCTFATSATVGLTQPGFEVITSARATRDTNTCIGASFNLMKSVTDNTLSYSWTSLPASTLTGSNPKVTPTVSTKYFLTVSGGCAGTIKDSVIVKVFTPPVLNGANDTVVCRDTKIKLGNTLVDTTVKYVWSPNFGIDSVNNPNATLTVQPSLSDVVPVAYYLVATNLGGCVTRDTVNVVGVDLRMKITPADSTRLCRGSSLNLVATTSPKVGSAVKWRSDKDYNLADSINQITVSPSRVTKYYATISQKACTRNDSVTVYVDSLPFRTNIIPQDTNICMGAVAILRSPVYENVLFPKIKHNWAGGKGFITSDTLYDMVIQGDSTRTYSRINTNGVCKTTDTVRVIVTPLPKVTLTPANSIFCVGDNKTITLKADTMKVTSIKWKDPMGQEIKSNEGKLTYDVSSSSPGTYTVEVKNGSCPSSASASISVQAAPDFGKPKDYVCANSSIALNTMPNNSYTYAWTGPNGFTSTLAAPVVTPTAASTYNVVVSSANKCTSTFSVTVTPAIGSVITSADPTICVGGSTTLTATGTSNTNNGVFSWSTGANTPAVTVSPSKSSSYTVTYTYGDNCVATKTVNVTVTPGIQVFIVPDTFAKFVDEGTALKLDAIVTGTSTAATYSWTKNSVAASSTQSLAFTVTEDAAVSVTANTSNGCTSTATTNVKIRYANFDVPNAFTPNGDTINNNFNIIFSDGKTSGPPQTQRPRFWKGNLTVTSLQVFSRFGKTLYEETNETTLNSASYKGWDGTNGGTDVAPDVYVYLIKLRYPDGTIKNASGEITLIR